MVVYLPKRSRAGAGPLAAAAVLAALLLVPPPSAHAAATPVDLGAAGSFAVLAGTTVTNTGATAVTGDVGVSPGTAVTGFPPGVVTGGAVHADDANAIQARSDLGIAYNAAAAQTSDSTVAGDLGGRTLAPGVFTSATSLALTGTLTLDAGGDPDAVFIFQLGSSLTTAADSVVTLVDGGSECQVFWQVGSSATLGAGSTFVGSILALTSVNVTTGATIAGRALARNGAVTLDTTTITRPQCAPPPTVPGAPTELTAEPGDGSVAVTFTPPTDDGGRPVARYDVSTDDGDTWTALPTTAGPGGTRTATVTGLDNGTPYPVRVRAVNAVGAGAPSDAVTVTPGLPLPPTLPPINVTAIAGTSSITVSWDPPADGTVTSYTVSAGPGPATCTTTALTCVLGGAAGTPYTFTVTATAGGVESAPSQPSNSVVPLMPEVADSLPDTDLLLSTDRGAISTAAAGQDIVIVGTGFAPHSTAVLVLHPGATVLGTVVTDATGSFSRRVTVPSDLVAGNHTIIAIGVDRFGATHLRKLEFRVPGLVVVAEDPGGDHSLPLTGLPLTGIVLLGIGITLGGTLLFAAGRPYRRRVDPAGPAGR